MPRVVPNLLVVAAHSANINQDNYLECSLRTLRIDLMPLLILYVGKDAPVHQRKNAWRKYFYCV